MILFIIFGPKIKYVDLSITNERVAYLQHQILCYGTPCSVYLYIPPN